MGKVSNAPVIVGRVLTGQQIPHTFMKIRRLKQRFDRRFKAFYWPAPTYQAWGWVVPLLLLVAVLGAQYLNGDNLWFDEVYSLRNAGGAFYPRLNPVELWHHLALTDPFHPPGFFWVLAGWGTLVGWTPFADRMLALFFGMLTVALTYRVGSSMFSRRIGFFAAAILSSSAFLVYYMHELRQYTALACVTAFTLWMYWRVAAPKKPDRFAPVGLFMGALSLPYTHYMGLIPLGAIGVYHLVWVTKNRRWWRAAVPLALGGILFLPWFGTLWHLSQQYTNQPVTYNAMPPDKLLLQTSYAFGNASILLFVIVLVCALTARGRSSNALFFITTATVLLYIIANFKLHVLAKERLRYLITLWPLLALIAALGMEQLKRRGLRPELALGVWLAIGIWHSPGVEFARQLSLDGAWTPDWQALGARVKAREHPGDAFVFLGYSQGDEIAFQFYTHDLKSSTFFVPGILWNFSDRTERITQAAEYVAVAPRFWVAYDRPPATFMPTDFQARLADYDALCGSYSEGPEFWLQLFARIPDSPVFRFGDGLLPPAQVLGLSLIDPFPVKADHSLDVRLGWSAQAGIPADVYEAVLDLERSDGTPVLRQTFGLAAGKSLCQTQTFDMRDLPPGEYEVRVTVLAQGSPLPGIRAATGEKSNVFLLGTFHKVLPPRSG